MPPLLWGPPAFGALVVRGGGDFGDAAFTPEIAEDADKTWPNLLVFLQTGRVAWLRKRITIYNGPSPGIVDFYDAGHDALLLFTAVLLQILGERSAQTEATFFLSEYCEHHLMQIDGTRIRYLTSAHTTSTPMVERRPLAPHDWWTIR